MNFKKILSTLLILTIFSSFICLNPKVVFAEELDNAELVDYEVIPVELDTGESFEIVFEEYRHDSLDESAVLFSLSPEHPVGYTTTWNFYVSNLSLGGVSLAAGTPMTKKAKEAIAKVVAKKLGEKVGSSLIPGVNILSWVLSGISYFNERAGNNGFHIAVKGKYGSYYSPKEGYYRYGWDFTKISINPY